MPLTLVTAPTVEPIDLALAKAQCRIHPDVTDEDALLTSYIQAARARCEDVTGRQLMTATYDLTLHQFPACGAIEVPILPVQSVTHVKYTNTAGTLTTVTAADYVVSGLNSAKDAAWISLAVGESWPTTIDQANAVVVRIVAGYGASLASLPAALAQGMLLLIGSWYAQREDLIVGTIAAEIPQAARALWKPYYWRPTQREAA